MPQTTKIEVNPNVLQWARTEAGYEPAEIADKLGIKPSRYENWESNGKEIPLGILKRIANYYKRQLAVFMLPEAPPKLQKPKDFRNLALSQAGLSPETLLAMRRAQRYLEIAREITGENYWHEQYEWITETESIVKKDNTVVNDELLGWLRAKLKIDIESQTKFRDYKAAFKQWRNSIETELGIFIFHFPMPDKELDGFCYAGKAPPYAIVINSKSRDPRKIFTLFHEFAHILKHQSGICLPDLSSEEQDIEFECNDFSGKFLIPDSHVYPADNLEELTTLGRTFKVSREVYLRRNLERNFISRNQFFTLLKEIRTQVFTPGKKKKGGPVKPTIMSKSVRGEMFYNMIMNAVYDNKIDYSAASDALNLSVNYIANE